MDEQVLCVRSLLFDRVGRFYGFNSNVQQLSRLFDVTETEYRPRSTVETDQNYKQLIPYCIFQHDDLVFQYRRGKAGGENRLHDKLSIGVGGHISRGDSVSGLEVYHSAMLREIEEEISIAGNAPLPIAPCVGMVNDDTNPVGAVHLGVVHVFRVPHGLIKSREDALVDAGFVHRDQLVADIDQFETWSQFCISYLYGRMR
jgi:predicted NUDIX family phosphoesterase